MAKHTNRPRHLHRTLAPIMLLPVVLTLVTGTFYQIFDLMGQGNSVDWLLEAIHKVKIKLRDDEASAES